VRFTVLDHRTHAIAFVADSLGAQARTFLERTGQLRGPPLVSEGASWVVVLDGAPPGRYPFLCRSHDVRGVLTISGAR
jgi:plastocyanin